MLRYVLLLEIDEEIALVAACRIKNPTQSKKNVLGEGFSTIFKIYEPRRHRPLTKDVGKNFTTWTVRYAKRIVPTTALKNKEQILPEQGVNTY